METGYGQYCPIAKGSEVLAERWTPLIIRNMYPDRPPRERYWLVLRPPLPEVCVKPPGFDEDIVLRTDCVTLTDFHRGRLDFARAMQRGAIEAEGPSDLLRALPTWGGLSYYADVRPAR